MQLATWIGPAGRVYATDVGEAQLAASCLLVVAPEFYSSGWNGLRGSYMDPGPSVSGIP